MPSATKSSTRWHATRIVNLDVASAQECSGVSTIVADSRTFDSLMTEKP